MWSSKDVYYVSDSTAILAESMGRGLLCHFHETSFNEEKIPFVRTKEDAEKAIEYILSRSGGRFPLVFCTIMKDEVRGIIDSPQVEFFDLFIQYLDRLEQCLETKAIREVGHSRHGDDLTLAKRVEAINYCLNHDDGTKTWEYDSADIILLGVSRAGKTPVSVYLATQMGFKTANFPLTSEQLEKYELPKEIVRNAIKTIALTTTTELLHKVREQRYSGSRYASRATCSNELRQAQEIYSKYAIQSIETSGKSIEETAVQVIQLLGISKKSLRI
ncbi:MAG: pyruvate, phosphate dikinase/phosphoenolpyruvate synthase regulator [Desulfobulbaceae bacterium]|nr:pyruvate, phosphate dikinase/phosphoenolpyruvate synthase regulator [Desulfobulbaceae bacterium]